MQKKRMELARNAKDFCVEMRELDATNIHGLML